jgi:hypothetical protein
VGDLVAADNDEEEPKPIIGWIINIDKHQTHPEKFYYEVEWADGVKDEYTETLLETYIKLYKKLKRRKYP